MDNTEFQGDDKITVIPYCPLLTSTHQQSVIITTLCFWYQGRIIHPVTDHYMRQFLRQVQLFGAMIYPDLPELGCYAIDAQILPKRTRQIPVSEIRYKGEVIYCRCLPLQSYLYEKDI